MARMLRHDEPNRLHHIVNRAARRQVLFADRSDYRRFLAIIACAVRRFTPETHEGQRLIAHELTHVVQQTHGNRYVQRAVFGIQAKLVVGQPGNRYEQEADLVAEPGFEDA